MKKNIFTKLMTLALVGALLVPSVQTQAASKAATAKKALVAKAEKIAIADANKRSVIPVYYGLVDINGDKVTEMVTAQGANTNTLTIYGYTNKVKKFATIKDVSGAYLDKKAKKLIVISGSGETSKSKVEYIEYAMNKKGTKLVKKDTYTCTGKNYKKNGKKISTKAGDKYVEAVYKLKSVSTASISDAAQAIYDGNIAFNVLSGSVELLKDASVEVKLYSVEATEKGEEKKEVKSVTMEAGKTVTDEAATIGIFNLNDPKLIEGEEFSSNSSDEDNDYIMTIVPKEAVGTILPGFTLPENTMEVIARYTINGQRQLIDVDFICNTGAPVTFAEYTFTYKD